ncbi:MAG: DoxX family membrane protein [Candidatus Nanohaloarchaea archaeon]|nr:DoxX family membrane protein [Candidatus Nanohaloarchaea archaeon]
MDLYRRLQDYLAQYSGSSYTIFRSGLGLMILLSGVHQLVNPTLWTSYIAPVFANLMNQTGISGAIFMQVNGVFEILFGVALVMDRYTTLAAGLVTVSMAGIIVNLGLAGAGYIDIIVRDIGLLLLALGVTLQSARRTEQ